MVLFCFPFVHRRVRQRAGEMRFGAVWCVGYCPVEKGQDATTPEIETLYVHVEGRERAERRAPSFVAPNRRPPAPDSPPHLNERSLVYYHTHKAPLSSRIHTRPRGRAQEGERREGRSPLAPLTPPCPSRGRLPHDCTATIVFKSLETRSWWPSSSSSSNRSFGVAPGSNSPGSRIWRQKRGLSDRKLDRDEDAFFAVLLPSRRPRSQLSFRNSSAASARYVARVSLYLQKELTQPKSNPKRAIYTAYSHDGYNIYKLQGAF